MNERRIVAFLHSRFGTLLMALIAVSAITLSVYIYHIPTNIGMWFLSISELITNPTLSFITNLFVLLSTAALLIIINKRFNVLRSTSHLFAGLFLIMMASQPIASIQFNAGTLMCMIIIISTAVLFSTFNRPFPRQPIFLIFLLLCTGAIAQYAYVLYIPIFMLGCGQMRVFDLKSFTAAMLGCITPIWIMCGFGLISITELPLPQFADIFESIDKNLTLNLLVTTSFSLLLMLSMGVLNILNVYNLNSQMRAFNGFFSILTFATAIFAIADYGNIISYIPLINCCAAFQTGHFFIANQHKRSYIAIIGIIAIYATFYWWNSLA